MQEITLNGKKYEVCKGDGKKAWSCSTGKHDNDMTTNVVYVIDKKLIDIHHAYSLLFCADCNRLIGRFDSGTMFDRYLCSAHLTIKNFIAKNAEKRRILNYKTKTFTEPAPFITYNMLDNVQACFMGLDWFRRNFPDGTTIDKAFNLARNTHKAWALVALPKRFVDNIISNLSREQVIRLLNTRLGSGLSVAHRCAIYFTRENRNLNYIIKKLNIKREEELKHK